MRNLFLYQKPDTSQKARQFLLHFIYDVFVNCPRDKGFSIKKLGMENKTALNGKYDRARN